MLPLVILLAVVVVVLGLGGYARLTALASLQQALVEGIRASLARQDALEASLMRHRAWVSAHREALLRSGVVDEALLAQLQSRAQVAEVERAELRAMLQARGEDATQVPRSGAPSWVH